MDKVTYYGHSCFLVSTGGKNIIFDPFISENPLASKIKVEEIQADFMLLSHGHHDHVADAVSIAKRNNLTVIGIYELAVWCQNQGVEKIHQMNTGGVWEFDFGKVQLVNALHSSSFKDGSYAGNPTGFVIENKEHTFYYAGDTALTLDMKLISERYQLDFAFLPIGSNFTMDIQDAVKASEFIKCDKIIGMHYDTFGFIKIDKEKAVKAFAKAGKELILMEIGQTIAI
jgi:L-ascorbate metabolism protein UlaG (beta-lactamase superfamily)